MIVVKLSYSILNAWSKGRWEDAVSMYLGRDLPEIPEIELGKLKHQRWAQYTLAHGRIHPELGGGKVINPVVEQKYEKILPLNEKMVILLRGIPDLTSDHPDGKGGLLYTEYKCGMRNATSYVDDLQMDYMKLLEPRMREGRYICYNPYFKTKTIGVRFLTDKNAMNALEHIMTYGGELISYLQVNKMLVNYKGGKYGASQQVLGSGEF